MRQEYTLYKGEEIIGHGTAKELAKKLNVKEEIIKWYARPSSAKRGENVMVAVKL